MQADLLKDLRDIHIPAEPSWWPLAPGWWILLLISLLTIVIMTLFIKSRKKTTQQFSGIDVAAYQHDFASIQQAYIENKNSLWFVQQSSMLLRKISINAQPESNRLTGTAWLERLNALFSTQAFTQEYKTVLTENIYSQELNIEVDKFDEFMQSCLKQLAQQEQAHA